MTNISNYIIYGEDTEVLAPNFVHLERMEASRRKHHGDIKPHIHSNIFQMLFVESGSLEFDSKAVAGKIDARSVVLIPENTLHAVRLNNQTTGAVITMSQTLLERLFTDQPVVYRTVNSSQQHKLDTAYDFVKSLVDKIEYELLHGSAYRELVVHALLTLIFTEVSRGISAGAELAFAHPQDEGHFSRFQRLIKVNGTTERSLQDYAEEIGITTTHLNRICKATVGKKASEVIKDHIILEAKRHLLYTSHTVSEIAYLLEFSSPGYFNRYFKKEVGVTPKTYRDSG